MNTFASFWVVSWAVLFILVIVWVGLSALHELIFGDKDDDHYDKF